jgi:hypothetical protein
MAKTNPDKGRAASVLKEYGLAILSVAISTACTMPLQSFGVRTSLFFPAVLLSTWLGGTGPGVLAVLLSTLSISFFFSEPLPASIRGSGYSPHCSFPFLSLDHQLVEHRS